MLAVNDLASSRERDFLLQSVSCSCQPCQTFISTNPPARHCQLCKDCRKDLSHLYTGTYKYLSTDTKYCTSRNCTNERPRGQTLTGNHGSLNYLHRPMARNTGKKYSLGICTIVLLRDFNYCEQQNLREDQRQSGDAWTWLAHVSNIRNTSSERKSKMCLHWLRNQYIVLEAKNLSTASKYRVRIKVTIHTDADFLIIHKA